MARYVIIRESLNVWQREKQSVTEAANFWGGGITEKRFMVSLRSLCKRVVILVFNRAAMAMAVLPIVGRTHNFFSVFWFYSLLNDSLKGLKTHNIKL